MARSVRVTSQVLPEVRDALETAAIEAGVSAAAYAGQVVAEALGLGADAVRGNGGRPSRNALARLADRGGWFAHEDAQHALGTGYVLTSHYLREMVGAGLLAERVVPGASGGRKVYASTEPQARG